MFKSDNKLRRPIPLAWQLIVLVASLSVLLLLLLSIFTPIPPEVVSLFRKADFAICGIFLADFCILLALHKNRKKYLLTWGWLDFLSAIPLLEPMRWGRLARLLRIAKILRGLCGSTGLLRRLLAQRQELTIAAILILILLVVVFSSAAILIAEAESGSSINTAEKALWFTLSTVTTVGYGDIVPATMFGHIVASITMIIGIGIFGAFTALIASLLVSPHKEIKMEIKMEIEKETQILLKEIRHLSEEVQKMRAEIHKTQQSLESERNPCQVTQAKRLR